MAESKDLLQVLWSGADVLRGKMDANEYKTYLLGLVFYKYLSDSYLAKVYDLLNDESPDDLQEAQKQYEEVMKTDDAKYLLQELRDSMHYTLDPDMTYVSMLNAVKNNAFNREKLQAAFNRIQESDELFNGLFADVDLYSNRLGTGDQKQSATIAEVIRVLDGADLIHAKGDVLGNAYEVSLHLRREKKLENSIRLMDRHRFFVESQWQDRKIKRACKYMIHVWVQDRLCLVVEIIPVSLIISNIMVRNLCRQHITWQE